MIHIRASGHHPYVTPELVDALLERRRMPRGAHDSYAHEPLIRAWTSGDDDARTALARRVARHLGSDDAAARSGAIRFFQGCAADDEGALSRAFRDDAGRFEGVDDPIPGATGDLRAELARAISLQPFRARRALELLRAEALRPGRGATITVGLLQADFEWTMANAAQIVAATPGTFTAFVVNLALLERDLVEFLRDVRGVVDLDDAEAVLRERLAASPIMEECLRVLLE